MRPSVCRETHSLMALADPSGCTSDKKNSLHISIYAGSISPATHTEFAASNLTLGSFGPSQMSCMISLKYACTCSSFPTCTESIQHHRVIVYRQWSNTHHKHTFMRTHMTFPYASMHRNTPTCAWESCALIRASHCPLWHLCWNECIRTFSEPRKDSEIYDITLHRTNTDTPATYIHRDDVHKQLWKLCLPQVAMASAIAIENGDTITLPGSFNASFLCIKYACKIHCRVWLTCHPQSRAFQAEPMLCQKRPLLWWHGPSKELPCKDNLLEDGIAQRSDGIRQHRGIIIVVRHVARFPCLARWFRPLRLDLTTYQWFSKKRVIKFALKNPVTPFYTGYKKKSNFDVL